MAAAAEVTAAVDANPPTYDDYTIAVRLIKHQQYSDAIPHLVMALADKPTEPTS